MSGYAFDAAYVVGTTSTYVRVLPETTSVSFVTVNDGGGGGGGGGGAASTGAAASGGSTTTLPLLVVGAGVAVAASVAGPASTPDPTWFGEELVVVPFARSSP